MTDPGRREARLKPEYAALYPGFDPGVWQPGGIVRTRIVGLIADGRVAGGAITGTRLLRDEHFHFRGTLGRPEGWPEGRTRVSDPPEEGPGI